MSSLVIGCLSPAAWFDSSFALPAPVLENLRLLAVIYKARLWWHVPIVNQPDRRSPNLSQQAEWPFLLIGVEIAQ
jgi:hypothetical protein